MITDMDKASLISQILSLTDQVVPLEIYTKLVLGIDGIIHDIVTTPYYNNKSSRPIRYYSLPLEGGDRMSVYNEEGTNSFVFNYYSNSEDELNNSSDWAIVFKIHPVLERIGLPYLSKIRFFSIMMQKLHTRDLTLSKKQSAIIIPLMKKLVSLMK